MTLRYKSRRGKQPGAGVTVHFGKLEIYAKVLRTTRVIYFEQKRVHFSERLST
jgi:hypothetical protein